MRSAETPRHPHFPASLRTTLRRLLLRWYARHARDLPWRDIHNPYHVLVSEFMLQQTQVARVLEHFPRWIARFPDIPSLAAATRRDVLLAWSGMGYNRRALHLQAAARMVRDVHGGTIPRSPSELQRLPGVGRYTAAAIACFGYHERHPVVDINIRRVLSRLSANMKDTTGMLSEPLIWQTAALLLPPRAYYDWNQALMDLGAAICTARAPACDRCPLRSHCPSAGRLASPAVKMSGTAQEPRIERETPRRISRGRVIEELRRTRSHCRSAAVLAKLLFDPFTEDLRPRLLDILATLQRDDMIRARVGRSDIHDIRSYDGPLYGLRICLVA